MCPEFCHDTLVGKAPPPGLSVHVGMRPVSICRGRLALSVVSLSRIDFVVIWYVEMPAWAVDVKFSFSAHAHSHAFSHMNSLVHRSSIEKTTRQQANLEVLSTLLNLPLDEVRDMLSIQFFLFFSPSCVPTFKIATLVRERYWESKREREGGQLEERSQRIKSSFCVLSLQVRHLFTTKWLTFEKVQREAGTLK